MPRRINNAVRHLIELFIPAPLRPDATYSRTDLIADVSAGITVAIILIPQAMALALIAGLPAIYGLYAALPGFIASLFGSSKHLSTGPVAIVSFLTLTSLIPLAEPNSPEFIALAALLALLVGLLQLLMGVFRLGFVMHMIPHSAILGFSSAAAGIIIITQIPTLFGFTINQHELVFQNIVDTLLGFPRMSFATLGIGLATLGVLLVFRHLPKTFPGALFVLTASIAATFALDLASHGVELIAAIPAGLPSFALPALSAGALLSLLPKAALVAFVGFVEAHAIAKSVAAKTRQRLHTNQELVGQGLANIAGSFFHGYPVSGSFLRTAINVQAGARTAIAAVVTALVTIFALLFLTPIFHFLPKAVLASIVIVSVMPLIDIKKLRETYRISKTDGFIALTTFVMAFVLKPDDAIFIGIVLAMILFIRQTVWGVLVTEMGVDREWNVLRGIQNEDRVDTYPGVVIVRVGMSLYYANAIHIVEQIDKLVRARTNTDVVRSLVVDFSGINYIDITGVEVFADYIRRLRERGMYLYAIYMRTSVKNSLENTPGFGPITILHNIAEMKQYCLLRERTLILGSTMPEVIGEKL